MKVVFNQNVFKVILHHYNMEVFTIKVRIEALLGAKR